MSLDTKDSNTVLPGAGDPAAALQQIQGLLKAKDDTSRFVGLALLKSVLDNQPQLREDFVRVTALWEAVSPKFLDRLLRASHNRNVTRQEAKDMVEIAVAVLHTFTILLPNETLNSKSVVGRLTALVNALVSSSPQCTTLILQTVLTVVSRRSGALEFIKTEDVSPLTEIAPQQSLVLDIFSLAWSNAATEVSEMPVLQDSINKVMPMLLVGFERTDAVTFLAFVGETLQKLPPGALPSNPIWLSPVTAVLRNLVSTRPTLVGRSAYTKAAAELLQLYSNLCPPLFFGEDRASINESKPFSYLFISLLLIDIRSSFPSLLSKLNSNDYPEISKRLSSAFDIVSSFIGFLVRSLDEDNPSGAASFSMLPDLLLKLRKDIAETMSITIEYLRDRWDASVAGAAGLHPSSRAGVLATLEGTRLTLTWESMKENATSDNLTLASIRTLAIWLREDENENLRNESAGLMDMLVELYQASASSDVDFRYPVLTACEAIMVTKYGVDSFLAQNGWEVLSKDLNAIVRLAINSPDLSSDAEALRGIEIVRALLAVLDHESTTEPRENWMELAKLAASMKPSPVGSDLVLIEMQLAVLQLATALLNLSHSEMQKHYSMYTTSITGFAAHLRKTIREIGGSVGKELYESVADVIMTLEDLR